MEHLARKFALFFLAFILVGCGGGGGGGESVAPPAPPAGVTPTTGTIAIEQTLLRALPSSINRQRCTGFDSRGAVRFGPQLFNKAPRIELLNVSTAVTRLQIEYFENDTLVGLGRVPVTVLAGETTLVIDPPFDDVNATLESIVVTPAEATIARGTSLQFTATGNFSDGTQQDLSRSVEWASSSTGVATVSDTGIANGVAPGVVGISATLGNKAGRATLTVTPATITSISVTPNAPTIADGTTQQFTATATLTDNSTQDVTMAASWTSNTTSVATIDDDGLATSVDPGQTTITATANGISGEATLTVTAAEATIIQVTPSDSTIADGTSLQYTAVATFTDLSTQDVTDRASWTSSVTDAATIDPSGLATARDPGTTTISASFGGRTGQTTLTVTPATIVSVAVTPTAPSIADGTTQQFTATATLTDNSTQDVTMTASWTSDTTSVATIDGDGLATSVDPGQTTITATANGVSGEATLTVTAAEVTIIQVTPTDSTIADGTSLQYTAVATFTDLSTQDVTDRANWVSSDTDAATIDPDGLASAHDPGTTTISASFGGRTGETTLTVTPATIVSVAVTPNAPIIADGTTQQFTATATLTDNSTQDITMAASWTSNTTSVATIDGDGLATSVDPGQTTITATANGVSGQATLTVSIAGLVTLSIEPADALSSPGTQRDYRALGTFADGSVRDLTLEADWSSDSALVTVSNMGQATIDGSADVGSTIAITASVPGLSGSTDLTLGRFAYVPNRSGDTISMYSIAQDGVLNQLTPFTLDTGTGSIPFSIDIAPNGRDVYASTAGLGTLTQYRIENNGQLSFVRTYAFKVNSLVFIANGEFAYGPDSSTTQIRMFSVEDGVLVPLTPATIPSTGLSPNDVAVGASEEVLYVTNFQGDSVSVYAIDQETHLLSPFTPATIPAGDTTRTIALTPNGQYAYATNQSSSTLSLFGIAANGALVPLTPATQVAEFVPLYVIIDKSGSYLYVSKTMSGTIAQFSIGADGQLTPLSPAAVQDQSGQGVFSIALGATGEYLYATTNRGTVSMYAVATDGTLSPLSPNSVPTAGGGGEMVVTQ